MPTIPDDWGPARKAQAIDARREAQWLKRKGMACDDIYTTLIERGYPAAAVRWAVGRVAMSGPVPKCPATKLKDDCERGCTLGQWCPLMPRPS